MKNFIAFLRGINVSGHKLIKMADLKALLEKDANFHEPKTYIQSGNIVFQSSQEKATLKKQFESVIFKNYGFHVETLIIEANKLQLIKENHPQFSKIETDKKAIYYTFLNTSADQALFDELNQLKQTSEFFKIQDQVIYCYYPNGYGKSKWNNVFFEKKLKVSCTTRNFNTVNKMVEMTTIE